MFQCWSCIWLIVHSPDSGLLLVWFIIIYCLSPALFCMCISCISSNLNYMEHLSFLVLTILFLYLLLIFIFKSGYFLVSVSNLSCRQLWYQGIYQRPAACYASLLYFKKMKQRHSIQLIIKYIKIIYIDIISVYTYCI